MSIRTKKMGFAGKYRTRIGRRLRDYMTKINTAREDSVCPNCGKEVKRKSKGIWVCRKCGLEFAGGTHSVKEIKVREEVVGEK